MQPRLYSRVATVIGICISSAGACAVAAAGAAADSTALPAHPFAAPQSLSQPASPGAGSLAQVTLSLLLVLLAVFAVAWVVRRMRSFGNRVGDAIDVIADVPLGQKERAVLLQVGQTQILVGVAPGQVNTLHVLTEPLDKTRPPLPQDATGPNFKTLLLRSLGK